jgi:hypothetical protein
MGMKIDKIEIGGVTYHVGRLKARVALGLDKEVIGVILRAFGDGAGGILDKDMDIDAISKLIAAALESLPWVKFESLILRLFSCVTVAPKGKPAVQIDNESFDDVFEGVELFDIYKLAYEVMRLNRFSPFVLAEKVGIGSLNEVICTFAGGLQNEMGNSKGSEM